MNKLLKPLLFAAATMAAGTAMAGVTFFEGDNYTGQPLRINGVAPDFRAYDYNDRAMSMIVEGSAVEACADINFSGACQVFIPGEYPSLLQQGWTHTISSVRPAYGYGQYGEPRASRRDGYYRDPRYDHRGY